MAQSRKVLQEVGQLSIVDKLTSGGQLALFAPNGDTQAIGANAVATNVSVTGVLTTVTTGNDTTGDTITVPNGTVIGQIKVIVLDVDGGDSLIVTPTNYADGTTITFADANDFCVLVWNGTAWRTIVNVGGTIA